MEREKDQLMAKQKFELSSSIVETEISKNTAPTKVLKNKGEGSGNCTLNFAVSKEFRSEFKVWCAKKNLNMKEALEAAFNLLKNKHGD